MAKHKQIGHSDMRGDKGIALIHRIVNDMGFVWNALSFEAGIDGIIEIRDAVSGDVTNCILQVQSKAGPSYFKAETETEFEFLCNERDLDYWMQGYSPMILVVSRPDNNEAYWISVKDYFRDPKIRKRRKIAFNKSRNRFTKESHSELASLAIPAGNGVYLTALPKPDVLFSNLIPLIQYPWRLFRASTMIRDPAVVWTQINKTPDDAKPEWLLHDGFIYAFHDLTYDPWRKICIDSTTENFATDDFAFSDEANRRYVFLRMVGKCLEQILYRQGVRFCKERQHYYFRSTPDLAERKVGGLSVFKGYESKTTAERIAYYRHRAASLAFMRFDKQWYVQITPTYRFTQDGWKQSRYAEERLSGIKRLEKQSKTHLRQVRLWEEILLQTHLQPTPPKPKQLHLFQAYEEQPPVAPYSIIAFGSLLRFEVEWNVPEQAWLPHPADQDSDDSSDYRSLFDE